MAKCSFFSLSNNLKSENFPCHLIKIKTCKSRFVLSNHSLEVLSLSCRWKHIGSDTMVLHAVTVLLIAAFGFLTHDVVHGDQRAAHAMFDKSSYSGNGESKRKSFICVRQFSSIRVSHRSNVRNRFLLYLFSVHIFCSFKMRAYICVTWIN